MTNEMWKQTTIGSLLDPATCEKVATIMRKGGGARQLMPLLQGHEEQLKLKGVDYKYLAYAIEYACQTTKEVEDGGVPGPDTHTNP